MKNIKQKKRELEVFQLVFSDLLEMENALPPFSCKQ